MPHHWEQVLRFVRLFALAFLAQLALVGADHIDRNALIGAGIAAAEVVFRQIWPAQTGRREPDNSSETVQ